MDNNDILINAINCVNNSELAFCKFISANDSGDTGSHQSGFYIPKNSYKLLFESPRNKGENKEKFVEIMWNDELITQSRFIYYGKGTRNEYRLTRVFGNNDFLDENSVGDLLIICKLEGIQYKAYTLKSEENIDAFLINFNLTPNQTNRLIETKKDSKIDDLFEEYLINLQEEFPATKELAAEARRINDLYFNLNNSKIMSNPDTSILSWFDTEYELFKYIENHRYKNKITKAFNNVDEFIKFANTVLNRRKSRAGKSLEHHLSSMFRIFEFNFSEQPKTENNKKPDFIFPSEFAYHDTNFNANKLIFLASKTTCKDRWRQILNEADRIKIKYLFTLQRGISINQLNEMYSNNVRLVVPKPYISEYPKEFRNQIFTFQKFIEKIKELQG